MDALFADIIKILAGAALGGTATFVFSRNAEVERRTTDLVAEVWELEKQGIEYWSKLVEIEERRVAEIYIKGRSHRIGKELVRLKQRYRCFRFDSWHSLSDLRQAITGGSFEGATVEPDLRRTVYIQESATDLVSRIRNSCHLI